MSKYDKKEIVNLEITPLQEVEEDILNEEDFKPEKRYDTLYLFFSVISGVLLMIEAGAFYVWPSPAIVILKSNDTLLNPLGRPITTLEISMLTSIAVFASIIGFLLIPVLADIIGRKKTLQVTAIGMLLSGIALAYSNNIPLMVVLFSIISIFFSGASGTLPVYLTEICEDHNRAKYGCLMSAFVPLGQLFAFCVGPLFNLKHLTLFLSAPLIIFLISFIFAPESPVYSLSRGKKDECIRILRKLRNNKTTSEIDSDFNKISKSLSESEGKKKSNFFTVFKSKEGRIGLLLVCIPLCAQNFSGVPIIMPLFAPIFNEAGIAISGSTVAIMVGTLKVCMFTFTSFVIEKTGRKSMLLLSSAGASIPISTLGLFFYLKYTNSSLISNIQWLPVISILAFAFFYSLGMGPIPLAVVGEFFPSDTRFSAVSFVSSVTNLLLAFYSFIYPLFAEMVGTHWCMWIFGITNVASAILIYFFYPETKGKSIHEIQEMLKNY